MQHKTTIWNSIKF